MMTTDRRKDLIVQCLRVDADTGYAHILGSQQFFFCNGIRTTGFQSELFQPGHIRFLIHSFQKEVKLVFIQHSGSTPADVYRRHSQPQFTDRIKNGMNVCPQCRQVVGDQGQQFRGCIRNKRTIGATGWAERNTNIHTARTAKLRADQSVLGLRYCHCQLRFAGHGKILATDALGSRCRRISKPNQFRGDLRRTHTGQNTPRRTISGQCGGCFIKGGAGRNLSGLCQINFRLSETLTLSGFRLITERYTHLCPCHISLACYVKICLGNSRCGHLIFRKLDSREKYHAQCLRIIRFQITVDS